MRHSLVRRFGVGLVFAIGIAIGGVLVGSCGGGSGSAHGAAPTTLGVRHLHHVSLPLSATLDIGQMSAVATTAFTPSHADDVILGFRLRFVATASGAATGSQCIVSLDAATPDGPMHMASGSLFAPADLGASQTIESSGAAPVRQWHGPTTWDLTVRIYNLMNAPTTIDFAALDIEVDTLESVSTSDPSPNFS